MAELNIHDLYKSKDDREDKRKKTFQDVLQKIHAKIKSAAMHDHQALFYTVPEYIVGIPLYSITDCIEFVVSSLKQNGFLVRYIYPNAIYVNWDPKQINKPSMEMPATLRLGDRNHGGADEILLPHRSSNKHGKFSLNIDEF